MNATPTLAVELVGAVQAVAAMPVWLARIDVRHCELVVVAYALHRTHSHVSSLRMKRVHAIRSAIMIQKTGVRIESNAYIFIVFIGDGKYVASQLAKYEFTVVVGHEMC